MSSVELQQFHTIEREDFNGADKENEEGNDDVAETTDNVAETTTYDKFLSILGQIKTECICDQQAWRDYLHDIKTECTPMSAQAIIDLKPPGAVFWQNPYLPALHNPGWLLRYILGPHTPELGEKFTEDISAGIIVAMTLVPQVYLTGWQ